ncbi:bifunctional folylpolyglutamate synthase/dihydrofolate synthase [Halpernia frigidisoli]|uniref:Dihydrofolate synthase/folylpolyglutamate synthase n=1 Tax=Halpernia frigidisoli TaxID=1125876 RepID=A0A1I3GXS2_9FLAO|nr:folylpolyglutamate synthase/dihydrofolate synthase family protein [Halpernia frigidisoli]SFI28325.1 dihydrofolate synthase / folylpolyglutamate synthase [Halpernia frigidisoli]
MLNEDQYQKDLNWLFAQLPNYQTVGQSAYKPGLENIKKLCDFFGNPQENLKMIHIGGTNGKGSTSNMTASILQESGYKVGLYTSPHLVDFRERIKINGENCDKEFVFSFIQKLKNLPQEFQPSFFEFTTIMAFEYFEENKVDFAMIEVGLGGRLDSTNIINPILTAITNVDLDHQNLLGNTIGEIAFEKAGIIKENIPIISGTENPEVFKILKETAANKNSKFIDATEFSNNYKSDLTGNYQGKNIKVVVKITEELRKQKIEIPEKSLVEGLMNVQKNTGFIGRWTVFSENPLTILDTAHNLAGLELVFKQLETYKTKKHLILGFVNDKVLDQILQILPPKETYYFIKPNVERGRNPSDYEEDLKKYKINYKIFENLSEAYSFALQNIKKEEILYIGGSNFVVGEFLEKYLQN